MNGARSLPTAPGKALRIPVAAALLLAAALLPAAARAQSPEPPAAEGMRKARSYFEYGDYASAARLLGQLLESNSIESRDARGEGFRLLGLSDFYLGKKAEARHAFLEMLYLNPDSELDPFYVPPPAVAFFDQVKKEAEPRLEPMRALRRAEEKERLKLSIEEAEQRQRRELEEEQRRLAATAPAVEHRVVQREFWVNLLPFGFGQMQNGDRALGITLATTEIAAGATSAGAALFIEGLRDDATGKFSGSAYPLAQRLNVAKWVGAGIFYALWIGGAIHAAVRYQPETQLPDVLISQKTGASPPIDLPAPRMPGGLELNRAPAANSGQAAPGAAPSAAPAPDSPELHAAPAAPPASAASAPSAPSPSAPH